MLELGILKTWDADTHKAGVQLVGSLTTYLDNIAVATNIAPQAMVLYNYVLVAIPGGNPRDACVVASWPAGSSGGGGGVTDHGELTGLGDDDHSQYLNTARHDVVARHPLSVLDSAVCSETEADSKITTHKGDASAHHTKTTDASELTSGELPTARLAANIKNASLTFIIDGGGSAITTGQKGHLEIPFAGTIKQVTMLADASGSIVVDIWKDTYANFPPTDADSITAAAPPTISSAQKSQDATLTGWTTAIAAGDILAFNVDSCTTIKRVTISLKVERS
jgi:hypothetical protein